MPNDALLLVAGNFPDKNYYETDQRVVRKRSRIRIEAGFIPNEMMQAYLFSCDAVVVPYREILTSGTAMLAMSFWSAVVSV